VHSTVAKGRAAAGSDMRARGGVVALAHAPFEHPSGVAEEQQFRGEALSS